MTIHELMNRSPVIAEVEIQVFDLFHTRLIYNGRYEDSPVYVHMQEVFEYDITGIQTREYNPGRYYVTSMTITADVWED